jgi:threonine dehydrogenase-like Zn-dependent dehydrogenase
VNSRAIVQTAPRTLELREIPLPEIGPEDTILQVEACGICGSDYEQYPNSVRAEPVEALVRFPILIAR